MAEIATIARPYAEAAFEIADQTGKLDAWSQILAHLSQAAAHPDVQRVLGNPLVSEQQVVEMLLGVAEGLSGGQATPETKNFLVALAENDRLNTLPAISDQFEALKNERQGAVDAVIETAFEFAPGELDRLVSDLERRFKRKVRTAVKVDPELIGGARITVGDQVIDGSVRGQLAAMSAGLARS